MSFPETELRRRNQLIRSLLDQLEALHPGERTLAAVRAVKAVATADALGIEDTLTIRYAAELASIGKLLVDTSDHPLFVDEVLPGEEFLVPVIPIIRHQFERWSGGGFPSGLVGEEIPIGARILAVVHTSESGDLEVVEAYRRIEPLVQPFHQP